MQSNVARIFTGLLVAAAVLGLWWSFGGDAPAPDAVAPIGDGASPSAAEPADAGSARRSRVEDGELAPVDSGSSLQLTFLGQPVVSLLVRVHDGKKLSPKRVERHAVDQLVLDTDCALLAPGYRLVVIEAGTRLRAPVHAVETTRTQPLTLVMENLPAVRSERFGIGMGAGLHCRDSPKLTRYMSGSRAWIDSPVVTIPRYAEQGGKVMFTVLTPDRRPIGAGPTVHFTKHDERIVVDWADYAGLFELGRVRVHLAFADARPSGKLKLTMCNSPRDGLSRLRFERAQGVDVMDLDFGDLPFGSYVLTLEEKGGPILNLGELQHVAGETSDSRTVPVLGALHTTILWGETVDRGSLRAAMLYDSMGGLSESITCTADESSVRFEGMLPGTYSLVVICADAMSPPIEVVVQSGGTSFADANMTDTGEFEIVSDARRELLELSRGEHRIRRTFLCGYPRRWPVGAWRATIGDHHQDIVIRAGEVVRITP